MGLRQIRLQRGFTQQELADRAGVGQPLIATLERQRKPNPRWRTADRLAAALGMSPRELFGSDVRRRREANL